MCEISCSGCRPQCFHDNEIEDYSINCKECGQKKKFFFCQQKKVILQSFLHINGMDVFTIKVLV